MLNIKKTALTATQKGKKGKSVKMIQIVNWIKITQWRWTPYLKHIPKLLRTQWFPGEKWPVVIKLLTITINC